MTGLADTFLPAGASGPAASGKGQDNRVFFCSKTLKEGELCAAAVVWAENCGRTFVWKPASGTPLPLIEVAEQSAHVFFGTFGRLDGLRLTPSGRQHRRKALFLDLVVLDSRSRVWPRELHHDFG